MTDTPNGATSDVTRRKLLAAAGGIGAAALAGCTRSTTGGGGGDQTSTQGQSLSGSISIKGSSTVYPISLAMAEEFQAEHGGVNVSVDSTGTGGGFKNFFCTGNSDINDASRTITQSEQEQCQSNGVEPVEFQIAGDALTVVVNNDADWVDCVTFDELAQIWGPDGAQKWSDVRSEWPDEEFDLFGPASTSGTFDWFTEHVVGEAGQHRDDYEGTEEDNIIVQGVQDSPYAMGYLGYAYYTENSDRVKAVSVKQESGGTCTPPSLENAKDGSYPLARPLFIYAAQDALSRRPVQEFMRFYIEQAETDLVSEIGYVPESVELRDRNLEKLEQAIQDAG